MPEMHYVDSTSVEAIDYDETRQELHVRFLNARNYVYFDVPEAVFEEFLMASSKGRFLNSRVKGAYSYARQ